MNSEAMLAASSRFWTELFMVNSDAQFLSQFDNDQSRLLIDHGLFVCDWTKAIPILDCFENQLDYSQAMLSRNSLYRAISRQGIPEPSR
jgi:hypothetical protein